MPRLYVPSKSLFLSAEPLIFLTFCVNSAMDLHWTHFLMVRKTVTVRVNEALVVVEHTLKSGSENFHRCLECILIVTCNL